MRLRCAPHWCGRTPAGGSPARRSKLARMGARLDRIEAEGLLPHTVTRAAAVWQWPTGERGGDLCSPPPSTPLLVPRRAAPPPLVVQPPRTCSAPTRVMRFARCGSRVALQLTPPCSSLTRFPDFLVSCYSTEVRLHPVPLQVATLDDGVQFPVAECAFQKNSPAKDVLWCSSLLMYLQCSFQMGATSFRNASLIHYGGKNEMAKTFLFRSPLVNLM